MSSRSEPFPSDGDDSLGREMRRVVESLYGPAVRRLPGLDVGRAYWGAARDFQYGGDLVDVFHYRDGRTSLAVVDIAGHGIHAARYAGLSKYALRAHVSHGLDAVESVRALNTLCIENSRFEDEDEDEFFATVFFAIVSADRRTMQFVSAGHDAAYVLGAAGPTALNATAPVVGLLDDDAAFTQGAFVLSPGDVISAVTDGFSEARDERSVFLGADALAYVVSLNRGENADFQANAVTRHAFEYAGTRLHDDVAALVVKVEQVDST